jgi:hypothetical protein
MKHSSVLDLNLKFFRRKFENAHFLEAKQYLASPKSPEKDPYNSRRSTIVSIFQNRFKKI